MRAVSRELPRLREDWKAAGPVVAGGRVICTAPDATALYCLDLRSGAVLWRDERRDDDVYVAGVFKGKVLIVGPEGCRALALADGRLLWTVRTGVPSGRGTAAGDVYYLPLRSAPPEKEPAVCALDLEKGTVRAYLPAPEGDVPGNLVLCGDEILGQNAQTVTVYSWQKKDKEQEK
jgi:outer membrane protein assembly factor BamB